jgi:hypothetical protein
MGRSRKKKFTKKRRNRKLIFLVIFFGLVFSLTLFFFLRIKPTEKMVVQPMPPPPLPAAKEAGEARKEEKEKEKEKTLPPARLALIIDDGGYSIDRVKELLGMGKPMTFAILPNTPHGRKVALMAHENGEQVMLHLPMEPRESDRYSLEQDTVLAGMDKREIQNILQKDLAQIPNVRGVNNHMGSKATEDTAVMQALMEVLKKEGLFYIDSHTSSHTVGPQMARQVGVAFGSNDRFIDPEKDLETIKKAIRQVMRKAKKEGKTIAIGHPHPLTAQAIREMIPEIEKAGIKLVFASEVVG